MDYASRILVAIPAVFGSVTVLLSEFVASTSLAVLSGAACVAMVVVYALFFNSPDSRSAA